MLPRDPAGTTDRVSRDRSFKVGFADPDAVSDPRTKALIQNLEARTDATATIVDSTGEALLKHLADGNVDLAIGRFRSDSPWQTDVAFGPALTTHGRSADALELKAAMRNGENRWIMTVERASRAVAEPGAND